MSKRQRGTRRPSTASLHRPIDETPMTGDEAETPEPSAVPVQGSPAGSVGRDSTRVVGTRTKPVGGASVTSRSARRRARTATAAKRRSPLERYRGMILAGFAILGVGIIAIVFFQSASAAPWICESRLTPGPTETLPTPAPTPRTTPSPSATASPVPTASPSPSPAPTASAGPSGSPDASGSPAASSSPAASASASPSPSPVPSPTIRLGFGTKDLGRTHNSNSNATISYEFCPPTSGEHYNEAGKAPLPRGSDGFYGPDVSVRPGNWVHNLEHGYVVILYKDNPPQDVVSSIKDVLATAKGDTFATQTCGLPNRAIAVRFDDMETPFAVVAWDRAMLLPQWDPVAAKAFVEQWQDNPSIPENPALGSGIC